MFNYKVHLISILKLLILCVTVFLGTICCVIQKMYLKLLCVGRGLVEQNSLNIIAVQQGGKLLI